MLWNINKRALNRSPELKDVIFQIVYVAEIKLEGSNWTTALIVKSFEDSEPKSHKQGSHRNSKTQFHDFSMIFHDQ